MFATYGLPLSIKTGNGPQQEKMRGQRGRLPIQALGYVNSTKVILGLPEQRECISRYIRITVF